MNSLGDAEVAWSAAEAGAEVVRAAYGRPVTRHAKSGLDFATDADLDAERAILAVIAAARPGDSVLGEETGETGGPGTRRWLVDPLCGTLNFAAQTPLRRRQRRARRRDGRARVCGRGPDRAGDSSGATARVRRSGTTASTRRCVRPPGHGSSTSTATALSTARSSGHSCSRTPRSGADFGPRVLSTTLALAWVAAGRRAAYVSDGALVDNVHFAAGIALCQAAGCVVTDLAGGPVDTGRGLIAAADEPTHRRLLDLVRPHLSS